jgi:Ras-related GTP-binding protein C/D
MRQINTYLALVCVIKEENFEKQGLIDFNFDVFKKVNFYGHKLQLCF